ncbi:MAG TPA: hypothetical protein ENF81_09085 [Thermotogaceae bacterium]|nr:hypothetical protein [Thermotogaceae bacterium]
MRKVLLFLVIVTVSISVFALFTAEEVIEKVLESYKSQIIYGIRTVTENGLKNRYRYEEIYRNGFEKLVKVKFPEAVVWLRNDKGCFVWNNGVLVKPSVSINDLEDLLMNILNSGKYEIVSFDTTGNNGDLYELKINHEDQLYDFMVTKDEWQIIKIERTVPNIRTVLIYDNVQNIDEETFDFQVDKYAKGLEISKKETQEDISAKYVQKAISLFKAFMINRLSIKDMKVTFVTGETYNKHKLVVIIIEHSKKLKSSLKDITSIPKDFNIVSTKNSDLEIIVMGQEKLEVLQGILDSLISTSTNSD